MSKTTDSRLGPSATCNVQHLGPGHSRTLIPIDIIINLVNMKALVKPMSSTTTDVVAESSGLGRVWRSLFR